MAPAQRFVRLILILVIATMLLARLTTAGPVSESRDECCTLVRSTDRSAPARDCSGCDNAPRAAREVGSSSSSPRTRAFTLEDAVLSGNVKTFTPRVRGSGSLRAAGTPTQAAGAPVPLSALSTCSNNLTGVTTVSGPTSDAKCPPGYSKIQVDLNRDVGSVYVYTCWTRMDTGYILEGLTAVTGTEPNIACPDGFYRTGVNTNAGAGGNYTFLCARYSSSPSSAITSITNFDVQFASTPTASNLECGHGAQMIPVNFNQGTSGPYVRICVQTCVGQNGGCGGSWVTGCQFPEEGHCCLAGATCTDSDRCCDWPYPVPCGGRCCEL